MAALIVVVATLFVVTVVFSMYAVGLRLRHQARDRRRDAFAEKWREPTLGALAAPESIASFTAAIRDDERIHFVGFAVQYARRLRGDGRDTIRALAKPYLGVIARRADSANVEIRARAIQTLGLLGLPEHAPRVMAALDDRSPLVAMVAARALSQEESPEYAAAVLGRLGRFEGWNRRFLASMLAAMGPKVASTLREGLRNAGAEPRARAVLAEALLLQGDPLAGDVAAEVLDTASDRDLQITALRLLASVGRPDHAATVRRHTDAADEVVRAQALRALGAVGSESDVRGLIEAMSDPSPWVALSAARAVLDAGGRSALAEIGSSDRATAAIARQVLSEERVAA